MRAMRARESIEQFFQEGFALLVRFVAVMRVIAIGRRWRRVMRNGLRRRLRGNAGRFLARIAFDDLVEFAAIKPNTAALWAIIDFDALAFAHHKADAAGRAEHSGGGIHGYWSMQNAVAAEEWSRLAAVLKRVLVQYGLKLDPTRTGDRSSVLRVAGTNNWKTGVARPVRVVAGKLQPHLDYGWFTEQIERHAGTLGVPTQPKLVQAKAFSTGLGSFERVYDDTPVPPKPILAGCKQMNIVFQQRGNVSEPLWYAALDVMRFMEKSEVIAHDLSKGHPNYSREETDRKLTQLRDLGLPPRTCDHFESVNPAGCMGCPHKGKLKTPKTLGDRALQAQRMNTQQVVQLPIEALPPQPNGAAPVVAPSIALPLGYQRNSFTTKDGRTLHKIVRLVNDADGNPTDPLTVCDYDLWVDRRSYDEATGSEVVTFCVLLPMDGPKYFDVPAGELVDVRKAGSLLASKGIYSVDYKGIVAYMVAFIQSLQHSCNASAVHARLGWHDDGKKFVLGHEMLVQKSPGVVELEHCTMSSTVETITKNLGTAGTLAEWQRGFDIYNRPGMEPYAFAALAGFAAPLMDMVDGIDGTIISLTGVNGQGKTTLLRMVNSIWGKAHDGGMRATDTANAKEAKLGTYHNLPVMFDESTNSDPQAISDFCLMVSGGRGKDGMNKNNGFRKNTYTWSTLVWTTTNQPWLGKLSGLKADAGAEAMRVFEIPLSHGGNSLMTKEQASAHAALVHENYGHAGREYMVEVMKNHSLIKRVVRSTIDSIDKRLGGNSQERFWSALIATTLIGASVAKKVGLHAYDVQRVIDWAIAHAKTLRVDVKQTTTSFTESLSNYIGANLNSMITMRDSKTAGITGLVFDRMPPSGDIKIRYEPDDGNKMYINRFGLEEFCRKRAIDLNAMRKDLQLRGVITDAYCMKSLGHGTPIPTGKVRCWVVNCNHADMRDIEGVEA